MPIPLASNFKLGAALPLDSRFTKDNLSDLNAIPSGERYIGLEVYVISESKFYLWTGSTWIERDSSANITYPPQGIVVSTGTDWDTSIIPSTGYMYYTGSNWQFKNEEYALSSHTHTKAQITDFSHNHPISEITNLQSSLDAKVNTSDVVTTATANKILKLDANAKLPASITGNADGNASTATKLQTARTISLSGDVTGSASFDGSANAAISTALSNTGVAAGTYTKLTVDSKGRATAGTNLSASDLPTHTHTKSQITDFAHTHIISDVTNLQTTLDSKVNTSDVVTVATANKILKLDSNAKLPASITGNAATATKLETARTINGTSFDGSANITTSSWGTSRTITIGNTGKSVNGSANVSWSLSEIGAAATSHTHSNYTPFASNSQTIPMNTPSGAWYRIAASAVNVSRCDGLFELEFAGSGYHQRVSFRASSMYNSDDSIQIVKMGGSKHRNDNTFVIQSVRVVYYPNTYSSQYAYVEVYVANPNTTTNATLYVRTVDAIGWSLTTGAGSIPTNYVAYYLSVMNYNPIYNTNDKRKVITPSSGVLNIDLRLARNETVVSNITQNTTINISGLYDGAAGTIMLYLNGTYTITLGAMTNDVGSSVTKHTSDTFSSLAAGYYIIAYRVLLDASGIWRVFISISPKYS